MCSCQRTPPVLFAQGCNPGQLFPANCHASGLRVIARLHPALRDIGTVFFAERKMVGVDGVEPSTPRLSSACSNQLSYTPTKSGLPSRSSERFSNRATHCPPSLRYSAAACSPLRFERRLVELRRLELLTYSLQSYRSTN